MDMMILLHIHMYSILKEFLNDLIYLHTICKHVANLKIADVINISKYSTPLVLYKL
jgi:hypothetical protein